MRLVRNKDYAGSTPVSGSKLNSGAVAQLAERLNGIHEVTSSNLVGSTTLDQRGVEVA